MMELKACAKAYTRDQDKAVPPDETVARVRAVLEARGSEILQEIRRIDNGRLGIPVYVSMCGEAARGIMPTRKQMGKGASPVQAEASALMELVERYSFFTFWDKDANFTRATWSEARERWGAALIGVDQILKSVHEELDEAEAVRILDTIEWRFCPALDLATGREVVVPLDWFKKLSEFNGSSAGNTYEESIFQGGCELVERHVCALIDRTRPELPTIEVDSDDEVLAGLLECFRANGIQCVLKDFTLDMPLPTVAAVAWDPATFPGLSEIVYTAGTAASPVKAAIRALTEVAQLAGDFNTGARYEASGLSKYAEMSEIDWLRAGPTRPLSALPSVENPDIHAELMDFSARLRDMGYSLFSVATTNPELDLTTNYNFVPGFAFRERDVHASLGLFVGRMLAEEADPPQALEGLEVLESVYGEAPFLPFFQGLLHLRLGDAPSAVAFFETAEPLQPDAEKEGLAAFYAAYARTQMEDWEGALPGLTRAIACCPEFKEYYNLRGVAYFKQERYEEAAADFNAALDIDRGSAMDLANLGVCHLRMGHTEKARDFLETALKLDPSLDFIHAHLADLTNGE